LGCENEVEQGVHVIHAKRIVFVNLDPQRSIAQGLASQVVSLVTITFPGRAS